MEPRGCPEVEENGSDGRSDSGLGGSGIGHGQGRGVKHDSCEAAEGNFGAQWIKLSQEEVTHLHLPRTMRVKIQAIDRKLDMAGSASFPPWFRRVEDSERAPKGLVRSGLHPEVCFCSFCR
jgi:hypothetical protein